MASAALPTFFRPIRPKRMAQADSTRKFSRLLLMSGGRMSMPIFLLSEMYWMIFEEVVVFSDSELRWADMK